MRRLFKILASGDYEKGLRSCECSTFNHDTQRYYCLLDSERCKMMVPTAKGCAMLFKEGPEAIASKQLN